MSNTKSDDPNKFYNGWSSHRWSGWPGAYCMLCGMEDPIEASIDSFPFPNDFDNPTTAEKAAMDSFNAELSANTPQCVHNPNGIYPYGIEPPKRG